MNFRGITSSHHSALILSSGSPKISIRSLRRTAPPDPSSLLPTVVEVCITPHLLRWHRGSILATVVPAPGVSTHHHHCHDNMDTGRDSGVLFLYHLIFYHSIFVIGIIIILTEHNKPRMVIPVTLQ